MYFHKLSLWKPYRRAESVIGNAELFYNSDGQLKRKGDLFFNPKLIETFKKIEKNKNAFYELPLAQASLSLVQSGTVYTVDFTV